jgi:hypothetical protein
VFDNCPIEVSARANTAGRTFGDGPLVEDLGCGPYPVESIAVADVNADGHDDFLLLNRSQNQITVLRGDGSGHLTDPINTRFVEPAADFAVADLDRNGIPDVVVTEPQANAVAVYTGDGEGRFRFLAFARGGGEPGEVAVGDIDGDGVGDAAALNRTQRTLSVLRGDGTGRLAYAGEVPVGGVPVGLALVDLDRDGRADVVVTRDDLVVSVFVATGAGAFTPRRDFALTRLPGALAWHRGLVIADLNGDGFSDVAAGHIHAGLTPSFSVLYGDGLGSLSEPESFGGNAPTAAADFDGDGRTDVVGRLRIGFLAEQTQARRQAVAEERDGQRAAAPARILRRRRRRLLHLRLWAPTARHVAQRATGDREQRQR